MGASKEILIKMTEQEYLDIPGHVREAYLSSKDITKQSNDWNLNMEDPTFCNLYLQLRRTKKEIQEREYQLRELRRKENNK